MARVPIKAFTHFPSATYIENGATASRRYQAFCEAIAETKAEAPWPRQSCIALRGRVPPNALPHIGGGVSNIDYSKIDNGILGQ